MMNGKFVGCYSIVKFVCVFSLFLHLNNANTDIAEKAHSRTNAVINGKNMCVAHTIFFLVIFNELNVLKMADECNHLRDRPFLLLLVDISLDHLFNVLFFRYVAYEDEEEKNQMDTFKCTHARTHHI